MPIEPHHDDKSADQRDNRSENVGEAFVVNCLDGLRIVGDTKTGIARTARVVIFERERLEIGVKLGPQFQQRLQSNLNEKVIRDEIEDPPQQLNYDQCETKAATAARRLRGGEKTIPWNGIERRALFGRGLERRQNAIDD